VEEYITDSAFVHEDLNVELGSELSVTVTDSAFAHEDLNVEVGSELTSADPSSSIAVPPLLQ
jgi:molybdopterin-binding protein